MTVMRKLLIWSPAILFFAIIAATLLQQLEWFDSYTAELTITNRSADEISQLRVSLYDTACEVKRLGPGESSLCILRVDADAHYSIAWLEASATAYTEQAGYVTNGFDFRHQLDFLGAGRIDFKFVENN